MTQLDLGGVMIRKSLLVCLSISFVSFGFDATAATIDFDDVTSGTALSGEYSSIGVILSSTAPIGPLVSSDPADSLTPGQQVAPFVFAITAVPSTSTPTLPNKVIGAMYDSDGSLMPCERCGIRITFLAPLPTEVSLWISDPDSGQTANFLRGGNLLHAEIISPPTSAYPQLVTFVDSAGISEVTLVSRPSVGIGFDHLSFEKPVAEPERVTLVLALALLLWIALRGRRSEAL
jgi:hypothetical protein